MRRTLTTPRAREIEPEIDGSWSVSYGDMVTLLLSFFILFFSLDAHKEKREKLTHALLAALRPMNQEVNPTPLATVNGQSTPKVDEALIKKVGAVVRQVDDKVVVEFPEISFFASGGTDVSPAGQAALEEFGRLYVPFAGQHRLTVIAFADWTPVSKGRRYRDNLELSALRSVSAQRILQAAGLPLDRTRLGGHGVGKSTQHLLSPPDDKNVSRAMQLARRVVLLIEAEAEQK